jgi:hypothetical protein
MNGRIVTHFLLTATPEVRLNICKVLLDLMRRELAIKVDYLNPQFQEGIRQQSSQRLIPPWSIDEKEQIRESAVLIPRARRPKDYGGYFFLSPRSLFGQYLRRQSTLPNYDEKLGLDTTQEIILQLLQVIWVRTAASIKGLRCRVEPHLPPDVLGIYVYLPVNMI